jgi:hypothetical protein
MSAIALATPAPARWRLSLDRGRPFVHPVFDYLLIGGCLSLLVLAELKRGSASVLTPWLRQNLWTLVLFSNSAHFAASTMRLYTKPGARRDLPFLTMGLPLASLLVLAVFLSFAAQIGRHLQALYFTWSPYHYAAQAYGLSIMYAYRSGATWGQGDKRWLRAACFTPFLHAFLSAPGSGLDWLLPAARLHPAVETARESLVSGLWALSLGLPLCVFAWHQLRGMKRLPMISLLIMISNSVWLVAMSYVDSQAWLGAITVFHGIQYLAIVMIFHVRERVRLPGNARPWWQHAARFYLACLALGYLLFQAWPQFFVMLGFPFAESMMLVIALVNIHHFVVDAFIWRLRRDPNYAVVAAVAA